MKDSIFLILVIIHELFRICKISPGKCSPYQGFSQYNGASNNLHDKIKQNLGTIGMSRSITLSYYLLTC